MEVNEFKIYLLKYNFSFSSLCILYINFFREDFSCRDALSDQVLLYHAESCDFFSCNLSCRVLLEDHHTHGKRRRRKNQVFSTNFMDVFN
jgi:hypothetical protein